MRADWSERWAYEGRVAGVATTARRKRRRRVERVVFMDRILLAAASPVIVRGGDPAWPCGGSAMVPADDRGTGCLNARSLRATRGRIARRQRVTSGGESPSQGHAGAERGRKRDREGFETAARTSREEGVCD